ncbi:hypothetical protein B7P43_G08078 [Cryptotermes secundus]|uniref:Uncharacterized protein n=1 Tax=Cryptotermes secundus TaxID=105785 RepID=A0A2J7R7Y6_9NEOP|nr:hypothetical protein B7P43_G08078 [Cryptotermes secundus]
MSAEHWQPMSKVLRRKWNITDLFSNYKGAVFCEKIRLITEEGGEEGDRENEKQEKKKKEENKQEARKN